MILTQFQTLLRRRDGSVRGIAGHMIRPGPEWPMVEHDAGAPYTTNPTDAELAALDGYIAKHPPVREGDRVQGVAECPHCHWLIDYSVERTFVVAEEVVRILLECDCGFAHPKSPKDTVDCGFEAMAAIPIPEDAR